ncbi:MAG: hypothetical protein OEO77_00640 [Acidimicrobiia bacterium]|nr:hypothetical protein [Acidimicrobiia bacterium]
MFVYYFSNVDRPYADLIETLASLDLETWAGDAYREGESLRARLSVGDSAAIAKTVQLELGAPMHGARHTTVPLTWSASGTPGLFPRMEADLVLAPVGPRTSQVSMRGSYEPPLGPVGKALDRAVFHRIAEASVKGFVDRIARALEAVEVETV